MVESKQGAGHGQEHVVRTAVAGRVRIYETPGGSSRLGGRTTNEVRPHSALDGQTPKEHADNFNPGLTLRVAEKLRQVTSNQAGRADIKRGEEGLMELSA